MKTNYIPAIIMLLAGLVDCVIAISTHQEMDVFIRQLLIVLLIFLLIGSLIKTFIDRFFKDDKNKKQEIDEKDGTEEQEDTPKE